MVIATEFVVGEDSAGESQEPLQLGSSAASDHGSDQAEVQAALAGHPPRERELAEQVR